MPRFIGLFGMDRLYHGPRHEVAGTRLIPVSKWNDYHDWPPPGGLRHLIHFRAANGFDAVLRRVGRRLLIDEKAFFEWVDAQTRESGHE